jgi:hypothetical protein
MFLYLFEDEGYANVLNMSDKNSSLPKSGPPKRWIVLAMADL